LNAKTYNWLLFVVLSLIWGSSFILMKIGLQHLTAYDVASIRILSAGIVLLPFARTAWKQVPQNKVGTVIIAGLVGNFFPAFLYCIAEIKIDSSLAAILNALTPLCTIVIGVIFFQLRTTTTKIMGVLIGFFGLVLLPFAQKEQINFTNFGYSTLVLIATLCYGLNGHIVNRYLRDTSSIQIAALSFSSFIPICILILAYSGFFKLDLLHDGIPFSVLAAVVLGIMGTAIATIWFYMLVKSAGAIFASLVTYGIPFTAIIWGFLYGESINLLEILCLALILAGVYLSSKQKNK